MYCPVSLLLSAPAGTAFSFAIIGEAGELYFRQPNPMASTSCQGKHGVLPN